jgi:hypothetical protein
MYPCCNHRCVLLPQRNALSVLEMGPPETLDPSGSSVDTEAREPKLGTRCDADY